MSSAYLMFVIFSPFIYKPLRSSKASSNIKLVYKLKSRDESIQPCLIPFPIGKFSDFSLFGCHEVEGLLPLPSRAQAQAL